MKIKNDLKLSNNIYILVIMDQLFTQNLLENIETIIHLYTMLMITPPLAYACALTAPN